MAESTRHLQEANRLFREKNFLSAINLYREALGQQLPKALSESIRFNVSYAERLMGESRPTKPQVVGKTYVSNIDEAVRDMAYGDVNVKVVPGVSALIRAKNAARFIRGSIETIADLVDEIVAVDNNSSDETFAILKELEVRFPNLIVYRYGIDLPRVGADHVLAVEQGSQNTLGTYYNWCLSKVTRFNVLKWDADFVAVRGNLRRLIDQYQLRTTSENIAVWCRGVTAYYGKVFNISSFYDEYRVFSKLHGARWENWRGCETLTPSVNRTPLLYVYPVGENVKGVDKGVVSDYKALSPPIFFEIKDLENLKPDGMIIDARDRIDNHLIGEYRDTQPDYVGPYLINDSKVLVALPNLKVGGGNFWAVHVYRALRDLGVAVHLGAQEVDPVLLRDGPGGRFSEIERGDLVQIPKGDVTTFLSRYTHAILTAPLDFEPTGVAAEVFAFTHSEVSYFNEYILARGMRAVSLNRAAVAKFAGKGLHCSLLRNYLPASVTAPLRQASKEFRVLYCNRISDDKNVMMLLAAFKKVVTARRDGNVNLTILAGGSGDAPYEFEAIRAAVRNLGLDDSVRVLPSQHDVERYYVDHDLVVLPSLSEGCSLGLLEAINHCVPILSTDISANTEVTRGEQPHFAIEGLRGCIEGIFSVDTRTMYQPLLEAAGYVTLEGVSECSKLANAKDAVLSGYLNALGMPFEQYRGKVKVLCPLFLPESLLGMEGEGAELSRYLKRQGALFGKNADELAASIGAAIADLPELREKVARLKVGITPEYFSRESHAAQLANVLFGVTHRFVAQKAS